MQTSPPCALVAPQRIDPATTILRMLTTTRIEPDAACRADVLPIPMRTLETAMWF